MSSNYQFPCPSCLHALHLCFPLYMKGLRSWLMSRMFVVGISVFVFFVTPIILLINLVYCEYRRFIKHLHPSQPSLFIAECLTSNERSQSWHPISKFHPVPASALSLVLVSPSRVLFSVLSCLLLCLEALLLQASNPGTKRWTPAVSQVVCGTCSRVPARDVNHSNF